MPWQAQEVTERIRSSPPAPRLYLACLADDRMVMADGLGGIDSPLLTRQGLVVASQPR
jgi:hypothetical protein